MRETRLLIVVSRIEIATTYTRAERVQYRPMLILTGPAHSLVEHEEVQDDRGKGLPNRH